jgi:hypothetical protein
MKPGRVWISLIACALGATCHAQQKMDGTLGGLLKAYLKMVDDACPGRAAEVEKARAMGDVGAIVVTRQMYQTLCVCHAAKTRALLDSLPPERLAAPSEGANSLEAVAGPGVRTPCAGEQAHAMYQGKTCDGFKSTNIRGGTQEPEFCDCMSGKLAGWADHEIAGMMLDLGAYNMQFRSAKQRNAPRPIRPVLVDRYIQSLTKCGGGLEFQDQ